jgi:catechol 2,3-dioxygenase-like lactoylglutathione lyase family enzyme
MPDNWKTVAFVGVKDVPRARAFYRDTLGLTLVSEDDFALVFDAFGTPLRVSIVPDLAPAMFTVLGWQVPDIGEAVARLAAAGVKFNQYPGMGQNEQGIWDAPGGARVAWFNDPDGNILSVSQH